MTIRRDHLERFQVIDAADRIPTGVKRMLAGLYHRLSTWRNHLYDNHSLRSYRVDRPVVSIGNIAVGGTGKTPMVIYLVERLAKRRIRPVIISRGYGGRGGQRPERVALDGSAAYFGDEPCLMARRFPDVPVVIARDRVKGARWSIDQFDPDCLILDDGFQHRKLSRNLDIVLVDSRRPFTTDHPLPLGQLRESPKNLSRCDIIVFTHYDEVLNRSGDWEYLQSIPNPPEILTARHIPVQLRPMTSHAPSQSPSLPVPVCLVSGIGSPDGFRATAIRAGLSPRHEIVYPDHHPIPPEAWRRAAEEADAAGCQAIVMTAKDEVRLSDGLSISFPVYVLDMQIDVDNPERFEDRVMRSILTNELHT
ncbi:tetraacyldisaccharide 4'-kinase [bacterium]|nr:tetraacyldisaccharide 4'-kinase [candidate division CSSED10-310 bacterium]